MCNSIIVDLPIRQTGPFVRADGLSEDLEHDLARQDHSPGEKTRWTISR